MPWRPSPALALLARAGLGRPPMSYRSRAGVAPGPPPGPVDVIVPVHGAAAAFIRCLASVRARTDLVRHRLVVVLDGAGQVEAEAALAEMAEGAGAGIHVVKNPIRQGFVASVNRAMALSRRDVVLLNSDTVVTERWLEKLQAAAASSADIATVTPLSNNATICSVPRFLAVNAIPAGHDIDSFAALVERCAARDYPRLPTGVGMCLYVTRRAFDRVGLFDEARFGLGYGEETDFCMRALRAGYVHVLDDATFVYHAGQGSFGPGGVARRRRGERQVRRLHPAYRATIGHFIREDPLRDVRRRILRALSPGCPGRPEPRVLHVVHGWPPFNHAGTEVYARELALRQISRWDVTVYGRIADPQRAMGEITELLDHGVRVRLAVNNFTQRDPRSRNALQNGVLEADFSRLLEDVRPDVVHVHHLAGHCAALLRAAGQRRIPVVFQVHDWWPLCARSNLLTKGGELCSGPAPGKCARCTPLTRLRPAALWNRVLYRRRAGMMKRALGGADAVVLGSRFIEASYRGLGYLGPRAPVHVLPLGVRIDRSAPIRRASLELPLRFGLIGSIMPHKGIHVAVEAFRGLDPERATLEIWGNTSIEPEYTARLRAIGSEGVRFSGVFDEPDKDEIFGRMHVLLVPSLALESFGIVVREALSRGVPVLASRRGALTEAFEDGAGGAFFEAGDARALRASIERLCARPETIAEWSRLIPPIKGMEEHAEEIEGVYRQVLAGPRPSAS